MHALTMRDYYLKLETEAENASEDYGVAEIESKDDHVAKKESKDDVAKNDSKVVDKNETKYDVPENEDYDVAEDASEDDDVANNESKGDDVLPENESEDYDVAENTSEDDDVAEIESKDDVAENGRDIRINNKAAGIYSDDKLRFLVHNSNADGLRFLLTFMNKYHSLPAFFKSELCRVFFKNTTLSTLRDIFTHRQELTSYYRHSRFYPYPDKGMITSCFACCATDRGHCTCPILPMAFYVYCGDSCPDTFKCTRCAGIKFGVFLYFFHCKICHENYEASTKYQPYPQVSYPKSRFFSL